MMRIWPVCQIRVFRIREFRMNFSAICTVESGQPHVLHSEAERLYVICK